MIVAFASMKGGVGKTTLAVMFAKYIAQTDGEAVIVVDVDPQQGATSLLLGGGRNLKDVSPSIADVLAREQAGNAPAEVMLDAIRASPVVSGVSLVPATAELSRFEGFDFPTALLRRPLVRASEERNALIVVDAPPSMNLCEMCVYAADIVFIPITMSHLSGVPTLNTMQVAVNHDTAIGGLVPTMVGQAKWQVARVDAWRSALASSVLCERRGIPVHPPMPYSPAAVRGAWLEGALPAVFHPAMEAMHERVVGLRLSMRGAREPASPANGTPALAASG